MDLGFTHAINYNKFFVHAGVKDLLKLFADNYEKNKFIFFVVKGAERSGKTAVSFKFLNLTNQTYGMLNKAFFESSEFNLSTYSDLSVIIVDDFDKNMTNIARFVDLYNFCKSNEIILVITATEIKELDPNINSRIQSGFSFTIGMPEPDDLKGLIKTIGIQLGIKLDQKLIDYLSTRLPCSVRIIEEFYLKLNQKILESKAKVSKKLIDLSLSSNI